MEVLSCTRNLKGAMTQSSSFRGQKQREPATFANSQNGNTLAGIEAIKAYAFFPPKSCDAVVTRIQKTADGLRKSPLRTI